MSRSVVDLAVWRGLDRVDQCRHRIAVDGDAEADLGLDLVALGVGHPAHVVAEAGEAEVPGLVPAGCRPRPGGDPVVDVRVLPVSGDGLARDAQATLDERELPVAVGGLVEVHEVHVDVGPGQVPVELGVEVEERQPERLEPTDPHPRRGEGVHPGDDPDAPVARVGLGDRRRDAFGRPQDRARDDAHRDRRGRVEGGDDLLRVLRDLVERSLAIQVLAAGEEPDFEGVERLHRVTPGIADRIDEIDVAHTIPCSIRPGRPQATAAVTTSIDSARTDPIRSSSASVTTNGGPSRIVSPSTPFAQPVDE